MLKTKCKKNFKKVKMDTWLSFLNICPGGFLRCGKWMILLCLYFFNFHVHFFYFSYFVSICTWYCWNFVFLYLKKIFCSISWIYIPKLKNLLSNIILWNILVEELRWFYYLPFRTFRTLHSKKSHLSNLNFIRFASGCFLTMLGVRKFILHLLLR